MSEPQVDPELSSAPDAGSDAAGGRGEAAQGLTIPGYQPVERIGNAPSFGVWIRALQTRMDRRVLLKLLPVALPTAHEYFAREIAALVRLDGHGVLRVIDEGSAAGVRYLVSDEGSAKPVVEDRLPLGTSGWQKLGEDMESLYRSVGQQKLVLLPFDAAALRRRAGGEFVTADLGWLVPYGNPLPDLPMVPEKLRRTPAQGWMNARFLGASLAGLASAHHEAAPKPWRRVVSDLEARDLDPENPDPLAERIFDRVHAVTRSAAWIGVAMVLLLGIVAFSAWKVWKSTRPVEPVVHGSNGGAEEDPGTVVVDVKGFVPPKMPTRELQAVKELKELLIDKDETTPELRIESQVERDLVHEAFVVRRDHAGTRAATLADRLLANYEDRVREAAWQAQEDFETRFLELLSGQQFADAESLLAGERKRAGVHVRSALDGLAAELVRADGAAWQALADEIEVARKSRKYDHAIARLRDDMDQYTEATRARVDALREALRAEKTRYGHAFFAQRGAIDGLRNHTRVGDWDGAEASLRKALAPEDFPVQRALGEEWLDFLATGRRVSDAVLAGLRAEGNKNRPYEVRVDGRFTEQRGKVVQDAVTSPDRFVLKLSGMRTTIEVLLRDLSESTLDELARAGGARISNEDWGLLLFYLGDAARGLRLAHSVDPPPTWVDAVGKVLARGRKQELTRLIDEGKAAVQRAAAAPAAWDDVYRVYLELDEQFDRDQLAEHLPMLRQWLAGYWRSHPEKVFPGAVVEVDPKDPLALEVTYEFVQTEDGSSPRGDWREGNDKTTMRAKKRWLSLRGSMYLLPPGVGENVRMFSERMTVTAEMRSVPGAKQGANLNLVLWGGPNRHRALLFGLGWRPPNFGAISETDEDGNENQILLPINVIGWLRLLENRKSEGFIVRRQKNASVYKSAGNVTMRATSNAEGVSLEAPKCELADLTVPALADRSGTVEIRTYTTEVLVKEVVIESRLREKWFKAWVARRVQENIDRL